jgi:alpha-D-ribose 1-methylphosphonate 5-triphosphate diphosphatase
MTDELILTGGRIVTPDAVIGGTVVLRDGRIADIQPGASAAPGALDLEGDYLLPGLVELHTDNLEKHFQPRPSVLWPARAAVLAHDAQLLSAGITTVFDALAVGDAHSKSARVAGFLAMGEAVADLARSGEFRIDHFLHLRCELSYEDLLDRFGRFADEPILRLVSLMDHTPGQRQFTDVELWRTYYRGKYGLSAAEMDETIARQHDQQARYAQPHRQAIIDICRARGLPLASHDDATVEHVDEAVAAGVVIAEFPTTVAAARHARDRGLAIMMGGPNLVLGGSHSGNVSAAELAQLGLLDILSSDYVPSSSLLGIFRLTGDEFSFPLPKAVSLVTERPARAVGLDDRGAIRPGLRADLIRVRDASGTPAVRAAWVAGARAA